LLNEQAYIFGGCGKMRGLVLLCEVLG